MPPPREKPAPTILSPLARAAEPLYRWEINRRNRAFDRGHAVTKLDRPVLSVGNLSVGGTGKTPTVRKLLRWLLEGEHKPCVAMRGYKSTPAVESDEASAHRRAFPTVPVVAQPDRIAGLRALFETQVGRDTDCVVLDDGFQHRRLARDFDLVLVDASRSPFHDRLIPAGWLREPVESLARASAVVVTHAELATPEELHQLTADVERVHAKPPIAVTSHDWTELDTLAETGEAVRPVSILRGVRALAVCAIGHPDAFIASARRAVGDGRLETITLRDHDPYKASTLEAIIERARLIDAHYLITTDKDWSKLADVPQDRWPCPVARPRLHLGFTRGEDELREAVLQTVR